MSHKEHRELLINDGDLQLRQTNSILQNHPSLSTLKTEKTCSMVLHHLILMCCFFISLTLTINFSRIKLSN